MIRNIDDNQVTSTLFWTAGELGKENTTCFTTAYVTATANVTAASLLESYLQN